MPDDDAPLIYSQREVHNMVMQGLPSGNHTWLRDPEGNPAVQVYGSRHLPSQPVYLHYRPSVVKMQVRFTPRRISPSREEELWAAAQAALAPLRAGGSTARRQKGNTQETERDEQWVVTIPERFSEVGYVALKRFVVLVASCLGIKPLES